MATSTKRGLPVTTQTGNGHKISKETITDAQGKAKLAWCIVVDGVSRYAAHTGIAPSDDSRYLPLEAFLSRPKQTRQRRAKKDKETLSAEKIVTACMEWSAADVQQLMMRLADLEGEKRERIKAEKLAQIEKLKAEIAALK